MSLLQYLEAPRFRRRSVTSSAAESSLTTVPWFTAPLPPLADGLPPWPGREIDLGDVVVHVRETPGPTAGAPRAVFVHGLGGAATNWTELAAQLAHNVHGIAIDLPGFGRSRPPASGDFSLAGQADIVFGDRFGRTAAARFVHRIEAEAEAAGFAHALNTPYSGGHILDRHGDPAHGIHAIQIEWSRALYLDAALDRPGPGLSRVAATLGAMIDALADEAVGGPLPLAAE